jgi:hypothetical protein
LGLTAANRAETGSAGMQGLTFLEAEVAGRGLVVVAFGPVSTDDAFVVGEVFTACRTTVGEHF